MVVWHLADVSLNPSVNALPGGGTLQELTNGLGAWALIAALAGLLIGAAAILAGALLLSWRRGPGGAGIGSVAIAACACASDEYAAASSWTGSTAVAPAANWICAITSSPRRSPSHTYGVIG